MTEWLSKLDAQQMPPTSSLLMCLLLNCSAANTEDLSTQDDEVISHHKD